MVSRFGCGNRRISAGDEGITTTWIRSGTGVVIDPSYGSFWEQFQGINFRPFETFAGDGRAGAHLMVRSTPFARVSNHEADMATLVLPSG